jgi:hypothetical protein
MYFHIIIHSVVLLEHEYVRYTVQHKIKRR